MRYRHFFFIIFVFAWISVLVGCVSEKTEKPLAGNIAPIIINDTVSLPRHLEEYHKNPDNLELARAIMDFYAIMDRYDELVSFARPIFEKNVNKNERIASLAAMYLAYPYILDNEKDSAFKYLDYSSQNIVQYPDLAIMFNNTYSQYLIKFERNHTEAMRRLKTALDYAVSSNDTRDQVVILGNMASMYFLRYDTAGITYARQAYEMSRKLDNLYVKSFAAYTLGVVMSIHGLSDEVVSYIKESISYIEQCNYMNSALTKNYTSLASIYLFRNEREKAEEAYKKAFENLTYISDINVRAQLYISYAGYNLVYGDNQAAGEYYREALRLSDKYKYVDNRFNIYYGLSEVYNNLGQMDSAYYYHKKYAEDYRNTFSLQKEKELNNLLKEFDEIQYKNELQRQEIKLANLHKTIFLILMILTIVLGAFFSVFFIYRKKDAMYLQLVAQHQQLLKNQEHDRLQKSMNETVNDEQEISEMNLFKKLENLMSQEKIFKDPDISLAKLSEMLGTNRTYVSSIINKFSGKSFYNYIHSYRIGEAVSIISNVNENVVFKAVSGEVGYKSISCFYRAFQRETGCTPVIYREKVIQLQNQGAQSELPIDL